MREPELPIAWPSATAPLQKYIVLGSRRMSYKKDLAHPLTLIFEGSTPRTFSTMRTTTEKASLISHTAMSAGFKPALSRAIGSATVGASGKNFGSTPPSAYAAYKSISRTSSQSAWAAHK